MRSFSRSTHSAVGGFTLVEVIIALALVVALLGGVAGLSLRVLDRRALVRQWSQSQEIAEQLISSLDRDLSMCTIGDSQVGAGIAGDATGIRIVSRGVTATGGDLVITELKFDPARGAIRARRGAAGGDAGAVSGGIGSADGDAQWSQLGPGVAGIRLLYRDRDEWVEQFDSLGKDHLPLAVQVEIWFGAVAEALPSRAPDRVRVIAIPDAGADGSEGSA